MNDRFKFRVWNKHINEYCSIQNLFILPTGETGYFITDGSYPHQRKFMHQKDMIIEMSTGLKDNCGNLIYEGDIIKDRGGITYKIQWKDACFFAVAIDNFNYMPDSMLVQTWLNTWKAEIIGNIHEQAEQKD